MISALAAEIPAHYLPTAIVFFAEFPYKERPWFNGYCAGLSPREPGFVSCRETKLLPYSRMSRFAAASVNDGVRT